MSLAIFIFLLITPGMLALGVYNYISKCKLGFIVGLIFDLLIFIITLFGLRFLKGILTVAELQVYFNSLSFIWKYAVLTIFIGFPIAVVLGLISRIFKKCRVCTEKSGRISISP